MEILQASALLQAEVISKMKVIYSEDHDHLDLFDRIVDLEMAMDAAKAALEIDGRQDFPVRRKADKVADFIRREEAFNG